jgi:uncharacterized protein YbjT (DUF2867 family)
MKTVVITGASGVVGSRLLPLVLERSEVGRVVALGRRSLTIEHAKLTSLVVDLGDVHALKEAIPADVSVALCALGTTMRQAGSRAAFRAVDYDAVVHFAQAAHARGAGAFGLVSAIGANSRSRFFYPKVKGEAEEAVLALGFARTVVLRPSSIDDQGRRPDTRPLEKLTLPVAKVLFGVVGRHSKYAPVTDDVIAQAMMQLIFVEAEAGSRIVQSDAIHRAGAAYASDHAVRAAPPGSS